MEEVLIERRIFERIAEDFTGWYSLRDNQEILGEFMGLDFSANGIRVNSLKEIPEGRALDLNLVSSTTKGPLAQAAQVVWQRRIDSVRWQAGLKFYQPKLLPLGSLLRPDLYSLEE